MIVRTSVSRPTVPAKVQVEKKQPVKKVEKPVEQPIVEVEETPIIVEEPEVVQKRSTSKKVKKILEEIEQEVQE